MKIDTVRIFVTDIARSKLFYTESIGMPLAKDGSDHGFFILNGGGANLLIERADSNDEEGKQLIGRFTGISLRADNIHSVCARLKAQGITFTGEPEKQWWGGTLAHFQDPDGNIITLCGD